MEERIKWSFYVKILKSRKYPCVIFVFSLLEYLTPGSRAGEAAAHKRPHMPIGVFIADMPPPGRLVLAIAPNYTQSSGILIGSQPVTPQFIVQTTPWFFNPRYFDRVTPNYTNTITQKGVIHYGVSEDLSVAVTASYVNNYFSSFTFKGTEGIVPLGNSYTETMGFSGLTSTAVLRIYEDAIHKVTMNVGVGFPVGSNTVNKDTLRSYGLFEVSRALYGQQPSPQTYSFLPGLLYSGYIGKLSWGLAYRGWLYPVNNSQGWRPGNLQQFNGWLGYNFIAEIETTLRLVSNTSERVKGFDPEINGKTPGADPKYTGGHQAEIYGGFILEGELIGLENMSIATEIGMPFYQTLNGPQQKKNWDAGLQIRYKY